MSNPSKRIGSGWELDFTRYGKAWAHLAQVRWFFHRNPPAGTADIGDVEVRTKHLNLVVECKAERRIDLAGYMTEVAREVAEWEKQNKHEAIGVAVVKRRNHPVERGYAVLTVKDLFTLIQRAEGGL